MDRADPEGGIFIPECLENGLYRNEQCHKSTGYCWCVDQNTGKPIPGTSTQHVTPKCDERKQREFKGKSRDERKQREFKGKSRDERYQREFKGKSRDERKQREFKGTSSSLQEYTAKRLCFTILQFAT